MQMHGCYKEHIGLLKTNLIQDKFLPDVSLYFDKEIHQ